MGHHLNFRDPDGIALEFDAPTDLAMKAQQVLASGQMVREFRGPEPSGVEVVPWRR
jgi:hypothetical protein